VRGKQGIGTHSGRIRDVRKSPTGGKAGRGSDSDSEGWVEVREKAAPERTDSEIVLRLGSDHLLSE
jgi:hypothetical protein